MSISVVVELPDEVAALLSTQNSDLSRQALEAMALEGYRSGTLTSYQVMQMLGFNNRLEVEDFLTRHEIFDYTRNDLNQDLATLEKLR